MASFAGSRKPYFEIRESPIQGKGAFAIRRIPKGAKIIEYIGECIDEEESDVRYPDSDMQRHHTFLFAVDKGKVLDAGPLEWPAKYINHSCEPNCEALEEDDERVFVYALRTIQPGAELTYDYAYEWTDAMTEADAAFYRCLCGTPSCRGTILKKKAPAKRPAARKTTSSRKASRTKTATKKASVTKPSVKKASAKTASTRRSATTKRSAGTRSATRGTTRTRTRSRA